MTLPFLPNEADATFNDQAEPDAVDFQILLLGFQQTGVVSGCVVTESKPVGMSVDIASGETLLAGVEVSVSAQADKAIAVPDATNPRFDLVSINSSGTAVVTTGTAAVNPALPSIPANSIPLTGVFVPADGYAGSQLTDQTKTVDSDASSVTFNLPSGVVTGDDIVLMVSNTSDRSVSVFNAGDTNWTVVQHLIEPPVKLDVVVRTLTSSDSKTTVTANVSGTGNIHCWAYIAKGVDLTDNSVATNDIGSTFHQFMVDLDSGNTDPKYWMGISGKNQTGLTEQSFSWDYSLIQVHDETQSSPAQSVLISGQASSDQTKYRLDTDGPPHWPYFLKSTNEQMATIVVEFAGVDFVSDNQINDKRVLLVPSSGTDKMFSWTSNEELASVSSSSFAFKGTAVVPFEDVNIHGLVYNGTIVSAGTYQAAVMTESGGTVATITLSDTRVASAVDATPTITATFLLTFATPVALTAGTEYHLMVGRTDGGDTYGLPIQYPSLLHPFPFGALATNTSARIAKAAPAVSDTVNFVTSAVVRMGALWELA